MAHRSSHNYTRDVCFATDTFVYEPLQHDEDSVSVVITRFAGNYNSCFEIFRFELRQATVVRMVRLWGQSKELQLRGMEGGMEGTSVH